MVRKLCWPYWNNVGYVLLICLHISGYVGLCWIGSAPVWILLISFRYWRYLSRCVRICLNLCCYLLKWMPAYVWISLKCFCYCWVILNQFEIIVEFFRDHFGIMLASCRHHVNGICDNAGCWKHSSIILEQFWDRAKIILGSFRHHFGLSGEHLKLI